MSKQPRTVIVTGATAGVGRALALKFAREGDRVGLIARDAQALTETVRQIEAIGGIAACQPVDVSDPRALAAASEKLQQDLGPVDIWINDAMETVFSTVVRMTPDEFRRVTEVTYLGFVYGTMMALKTMRERRSGLIIQIGSALAYRGIPLQSAYCGAKHAIRGFTDALRTELLHERSPVRLMMFQLPAVNTPQFDWARDHMSHDPRPVGAPVQPEVIADAVYRASFGNGREYWIGAQTWLTIIGNALAPSFLDHYLARKAFSGQQTRQLRSPERPDNLERPATSLHRVRGSFSSEAKTSAAMAPEMAVRMGAALGTAFLFLAAGVAIGGAFKARRGPRAF